MSNPFGKTSGGFFIKLYKQSDDKSGQKAEKASAGAVHLSGQAASLEWTLMAGENADEPILGPGMSGYLKFAAWRADLVRSFTANDPDTPDFFSGILNIDLSWVWLNRNWYGFVVSIHRFKAILHNADRVFLNPLCPIS